MFLRVIHGKLGHFYRAGKLIYPPKFKVTIPEHPIPFVNISHEILNKTKYFYFLKKYVCYRGEITFSFVIISISKVNLCIYMYKQSGFGSVCLMNDVSQLQLLRGI